MVDFTYPAHSAFPDLSRSLFSKLRCSMKPPTSDDNWVNRPVLSRFFLCCLASATLLTIFLLYNAPDRFNFSGKLASNSQRNDGRNCDLSMGRWVPDPSVSRYTNSTCSMIPSSKNCFMQGRPDSDFIKWRWKPDRCELPRFNSSAFLQIVRGKMLGFIGDSVARNHMESLLCLLSQVERPDDVYKDSDDRFRTWKFTRHNFTMMILWSRFLVAGEDRLINGSKSSTVDVYLDRMDAGWVHALPSLDFAIVSSGHWFFRPLYLHYGGKLLGCVYCNDPNVTDVGVTSALRMATRRALEHLSRFETITLLRTFSPAHFENGTWNTGGRCDRWSPETEVEVGGPEWGMRVVQVEETARAAARGRMFFAVDVTRAMLMRPDGHPGAYWGNKWMKGYNDCVHWCLPGPIDSWNDFLMAVLSSSLHTWP